MEGNNQGLSSTSQAVLLHQNYRLEKQDQVQEVSLETVREPQIEKDLLQHRNVAKDMNTEAPPSWNSSCHCQSSDPATVQNALLGFMPASWSTD